MIFNPVKNISTKKKENLIVVDSDISDINKTEESSDCQLLNKPSVFIVLPTLNRAEKCKNVIIDVIRQVFKDWILMIVDDGSYHDQSDILREFIRQLDDERILYTKNNINCGTFFSINRGLEYFFNTDYNYFTWISDDNLYYPNYISELVNLEADFSYSKFKFINLIKQKIHIVNKQYCNVNDLLNKFAGLGAFMWSKEAIKILGFYDEKLDGCADYEFLIRTFLKIGNIKFSPTITMEYIRHDSSSYSQQNNYIDELRDKISKICNFFLANDFQNIILYYSIQNSDLSRKKFIRVSNNYNKSFLKLLIAKDDIVRWDDKFVLFIIPYQLIDLVINLIKSKEINILYTETVANSEFIGIKKKLNIKKIVYLN